jgi:hypothetical protein
VLKYTALAHSSRENGMTQDTSTLRFVLSEWAFTGL